MKKSISLFLTGVLLLSLCACGAENSSVPAEGGITTDAEAYAADSAGGGSPNSPGGEADNTISVEPGVLTAGAWNDNENFDFFTGVVHSAEWSGYQNLWNLHPTHRLAVTVRDQSGAVAAGQSVQLSDNDGTLLAEGVSSADGIVYLYYALDGNTVTPALLRCGEVTVPAEDGAVLTVPAASTGTAVALDMMLVFDTTGSMGDELSYLQQELTDVVQRVQDENGALSLRLSVNFYRDEGDDYVVRSFPFTDRPAEAVNHLNAQRVDGGGDYEEALEQALNDAIDGHDWRTDSVKVLFLILDAPPHQDAAIAASLRESIDSAARQGIRIIPVASSGVDQNCEFLLRTLSAATGGTYVFLTDDSGVGESHLAPTIGAYTVEKLNDLLVRLIDETLNGTGAVITPSGQTNGGSAPDEPSPNDPPAVAEPSPNDPVTAE